MNYNFERLRPGMLRDGDTAIDLIERKTVGDKLLERQFAAEDKARAFRLQINIRRVGAKEDTLAYTDVRAGAFDSFFGRGLREEQNFRARARDADRLFYKSRNTGGEDDGIGAAIVRGLPDRGFELHIARIKSVRAEACGERAAQLDRIGRKNLCARTLEQHRKNEPDRSLTEHRN